MSGEICITGNYSSCLYPQCLNSQPQKLYKTCFVLALKGNQLIMSFYLQMQAFRRRSWKPTTPTGQSTARHHWPLAASWLLQLRNGPITCWQSAPWSIVIHRMERTSSLCTAQQPLNWQVDHIPNPHSFPSFQKVILFKTSASFNQIWQITIIHLIQLDCWFIYFFTS